MCLKTMVGLRGFEPPAFSSRTRRATRLRYSPYCLIRKIALTLEFQQVHFRGLFLVMRETKLIDSWK